MACTAAHPGQVSLLQVKQGEEVLVVGLQQDTPHKFCCRCRAANSGLPIGMPVQQPIMQRYCTHAEAQAREQLTSRVAVLASRGVAWYIWSSIALPVTFSSCCNTADRTSAWTHHGRSGSWRPHMAASSA